MKIRKTGKMLRNDGFIERFAEVRPIKATLKVNRRDSEPVIVVGVGNLDETRYLVESSPGDHGNLFFWKQSSHGFTTLNPDMGYRFVSAHDLIIIGGVCPMESVS